MPASCQIFRYPACRISLLLATGLALLLCGCQLPGQRQAGTAVSRNPCVVLALPATGPYASVATKIRRGASLAAEELKKGGTNLRIENINTEEANWLARLEALPPVCAVVGGPLQDSAYLAARNSKAVERRVFFPFVPNLRPGDEGKLAWRFFPSPTDQIEALVGFGTDQLNIRSYGAFYPDDNYGRRMTELMESSLARRHMPLAKAAYNASAPATWSDAAARLINPALAEDGKTPIPQSSFEAVFLPDSWKHMDMLTNSLLYNGEDRLVLLGSTLWEQGLTGKSVPKAQKYALAVFPGAWNASRAPRALQAPGNDFWVALGYDFINFAVNTGLESRLAAGEVTSAAQRASGMIRAVAPIRWNSDGVASQELFLFQVGPNGILPLDMARFRQAQAQAAENAALRMQGMREEAARQEQAGEAVLGDDPRPVSLPASTAAPPAAEQPIAAPPPAAPGLSPTPQPSYKLRLPASRGGI